MWKKMDKGNWIPVDRNIIQLLPTDRPYTYVEAYISLREDLENDNPKGLRDYARLWKWSRGKVENFFKKMGYKTGENLEKIQRQKKDKKKTPIRLVLNSLGDSEKTKKRQKKDTNYKPKPKPKEVSANGKANSSTEVIEYMRYLKIKDPEYHGEKLFHFYEANGWVQGKSKKPIKNWKSAVRTWDLPKENPKEIII
jgi:hypothetical protein